MPPGEGPVLAVSARPPGKGLLATVADAGLSSAAALPLCLFLAECIGALAFPFRGTALFFTAEALVAGLCMRTLTRLAARSDQRWGPSARAWLLSLAFVLGLASWSIARAVGER